VGSNCETENGLEPHLDYNEKNRKREGGVEIRRKMETRRERERMAIVDARESKR
jgi:hypothetical protein